MIENFVLGSAILAFLSAFLLARYFFSQRNSCWLGRKKVTNRNEHDWHILVRASRGVLGNNDRQLLELCDGNRHLFHFLGRMVHFRVSRGQETFVIQLIQHLQHEKWRECGKGLLETVLDFSFDASDMDYFLIQSCYRALSRIRFYLSYLPQTIYNVVVREVIREKLQCLLQKEDNAIREHITQATIIRIRSHLHFFGLSDNENLFRGYGEGCDINIHVNWENNLVHTLSNMYQHPEYHTLHDLICACRVLPLLLVGMRRYCDAQVLLQDEAFCRQRSRIFGSALGTRHFLDDLELLISSIDEALVERHPTMIDDAVVSFSSHIPDDGDCLYMISCFLLKFKRPLVRFKVLEYARWAFHRQLETPLTLTADALEHVGTVYLVNNDELLYLQYFHAAKSLRRYPDIGHLFCMLLLYGKRPTRQIEHSGLIFRCERMVIRLNEASVILDRLLLTLEDMSKLPTGPEIMEEASLVVACLHIIDGIRKPALTNHSKFWCKR